MVTIVTDLHVAVDSKPLMYRKPIRLLVLIDTECEKWKAFSTCSFHVSFCCRTERRNHEWLVAELLYASLTIERHKIQKNVYKRPITSANVASEKRKNCVQCVWSSKTFENWKQWKPYRSKLWQRQEMYDRYLPACGNPWTSRLPSELHMCCGAKTLYTNLNLMRRRIRNMKIKQTTCKHARIVCFLLTSMKLFQRRMIHIT